VATVEAGADAEVDDAPVAPAVAASIAICVAVTVLFGVWPAPLVNFAHHAAHSATLLLK
jgi:NADH:ubiquinone oxidoreductase subunit 2 (subunit N)